MLVLILDPVPSSCVSSHSQGWLGSHVGEEGPWAAHHVCGGCYSNVQRSGAHPQEKNGVVMAASCLHIFNDRRLQFAALMLLGLILPLFYISRTRQAVRRKTGEAAPQAEEEQVLLTHSQLEEVRRQVVGGMRATNVFLLHHLQQIAINKTDQEAAQINAVLAEAGDRLRVTQLDLSELDHLAGLSAWREREAAALSQVVQQRLHALQHPANCATAKKLVCQADRGAGCGSITHDIVRCLMAAYSTGRTMVLQAKRDNHIGKNWEEVFLPPSPTACKNLTSNMTRWPGSKQAETVFFPAHQRPKPQAVLYPLSVPRDLASRISQFSDMPGAWLVGQFVRYLLRLQPIMQQKIDTIKEELNYSHPIVAIHVRRTDKRSEASMVPLEKYMKHVEDYYLGLDLASPSSPPTPRRVFLATELPSVVTEARRKYPTYEFLYHPNKAKNVKSRMTTANLQDFVAELYLLAHADYLVCTFSSNVGRLAFEWMQNLRTDASSRVASVDAKYHYYPLRNPHLVRFPHNPEKSPWKKNAKEVKVGDQVTSFKDVAQDGYLRINKVLRGKGGWGYVPDYKLKNVVDVVNFTFIEPSLD